MIGKIAEACKMTNLEKEVNMFLAKHSLSKRLWDDSIRLASKSKRIEADDFGFKALCELHIADTYLKQDNSTRAEEAINRAKAPDPEHKSVTFESLFGVHSLEFA